MHASGQGGWPLTLSACIPGPSRMFFPSWVEVPVDEVGGLSPCLHASLAPLECSLIPAVNTLQTLCLTLTCLSAPAKTLLLPGPSDQ